MIKRHKFDHTHVNSTTMKMGYAIPTMLAECLPGDTWQGDTQLFIRMAPMVAPVMHRLNITASTVFIPFRLLWTNFMNFITGGPNGEDSSVPPYVKITPTSGSLADYFGLPLTERDIEVSALPFRAYDLVYNWLWRDQDLQEPRDISLEDGLDTTATLQLFRGNWQKDYFTTARPEPQKGTGITIPLVGDSSIVATGPLKFTLGSTQYNYSTVPEQSGQPSVSMRDNPNSGGVGYFGYGTAYDSDAASAIDAAKNAASSDIPSPVTPASLHFFGPNYTQTWSDAGTYYNNTNALATRALTYVSGLGVGSESEGMLGVDVNDLLESLAIQRFQTRRSLFGSRYEDLLRYWGLKTQDFRLQEPELVSVGRGRIQFSEVLQTTPDADGFGVGAMAGHGVGAMRSGRFRYYCHEHGYLMTIICVRPQAVYTQGIERMWTRKTRWDYWNPEMQHIGQQEVLNKEIYADGTSADDEVFGYQNRFDEYRRGKNHVSGEFRTTLDYWNMARIFENRPALNAEFLECVPTDRIFQLSNDLSDHLYCMINNKLIVKRLLSKNGNPM